MDKKNFDTIVIGGGHAGVEASHILAKLKEKVLLISLDENDLASLPCNPSMGGPAKGIIIREVDALGGLIGRACDANSLQTRMLNSSKGPAVWALRMQINKNTYSAYIKKELQQFDNLTIIEGVVSNLLIENNNCIGCQIGEKSLYAKSVILATGTYLDSKVLIGKHSQHTGPDGKQTHSGISKCLKENGFNVIRLKTGTPPRLFSHSINYSLTTVQPDAVTDEQFSSDTNNKIKDNQCDCYITRTTLETKKIIKDNISQSPLYSGIIEGIGPRYCPSIEDKIIRFDTKDYHQIFLEPETNDYLLTYPQGLSSSMPRSVQRQVVRSVIGLEKAVIKKYGYAIEYDAINPLNIYPNLESKIVSNLFTCGQINGTSGYEEAAGQGIMAGINAFLKNHRKPPFILKRHEAYIGVLIDDLTTKGTNEPYRMLTSRAEYRLLLRHDNAYFRLRKYALEYNLLSNNQKQAYSKNINEVNELSNLFRTQKIKGEIINNYLQDLEKVDSSFGYTGWDIIKRNQIDNKILYKIFDLDKFDKDNVNHVIINLKYHDYIQKDYEQIEKNKQLENYYLGKDFNYFKVTNLSSEAREKLNKIKPESIAQASRIIGVNPSDISVLTIYLRSITKQK